MNHLVRTPSIRVKTRAPLEAYMRRGTVTFGVQAGFLLMPPPTPYICVWRYPTKARVPAGLSSPSRAPRVPTEKPLERVGV